MRVRIIDSGADARRNLDVVANENQKTVILTAATPSRSRLGCHPVAVIVLLVLLAKTFGLSAFTQIEELVLLEADERGQTSELAVGWPFPVVSSEAYTTRLQLYDADKSKAHHLFFAICDIGICALLFVSTINVLRPRLTCGSRVTIKGMLATMSLLCALLSLNTQRYWYHGGVGALSATAFQLIDALMVFFMWASCWFLIDLCSRAIAGLNCAPSPSVLP